MGGRTPLHKVPMLNLEHMRAAFSRGVSLRLPHRRHGARWDHRPPTSEEAAARHQEGRFLRKLWQSSREQWRRTAVVGVIFWALYAVLFSPGGAFRLIKLRHQTERVNLEVARLEAACDSLERVILAVQGEDPAALERVAREEFGFVRDNERIYVLPADAVDRQFIDRARQWVGNPGTAPASGN
jgi:cell division protein FtsB